MGKNMYIQVKNVQFFLNKNDTFNDMKTFSKAYLNTN